MWTWRRCAEVALLALLAGCAADEDAYVPFDGGPDARVDGGPDAVVCPPGQVQGPAGCVPIPADVCALVDEVTKDCTDRDGDCYVVACASGPAELADCDDTRADVYPGAPERCDGVDNDCDDAIDEGLGLGEVCDVCGAAGQVECGVAGGVACSTAAGQSAAADGQPELCNGLDDDCDDVVDEACRVEAPIADRRTPALCGDAVLLVEDGRLVRRFLDGRAEEEVAPAPAAYPACDGAVTAWLVPDGPCEAPAGGPLRCPRARLMAQGVDEITMDLTGLADIGPPRVADGHVYWHTVLGSGPVLQRRRLAGEVEPLFGGASASDPSPIVAGRVAVRRWAEGEAQVDVQGLDGEASVRVDAAPGPAGPPALDGDWVAWVIDAEPPAVWAVPLARPREGFQVTAGGRPAGRPWLEDGWVVWLDADGLRGFDLASGADLRLPGPQAPEDVDVRDGRVAWLEAGSLYLALLEGGPAVPGEVVDAVAADAGAADAGATDATPDAAE
ncbi:MAG: putative metal-binding motif-containing protein [Myxococcales bacterium]|nr:putative metal-binding motif-containing protein [Myxococcales bacterium]